MELPAALDTLEAVCSQPKHMVLQDASSPAYGDGVTRQWILDVGGCFSLSFLFGFFPGTCVFLFESASCFLQGDMCRDREQSRLAQLADRFSFQDACNVRNLTRLEPFYKSGPPTEEEPPSCAPACQCVARLEAVESCRRQATSTTYSYYYLSTTLVLTPPPRCCPRPEAVGSCRRQACLQQQAGARSWRCRGRREGDIGSVPLPVRSG